MRFNLARLGSRWLVLASVVILPFVRFLLRNHYPLLRTEVAAAAAVLAIVCLALAAFVRARMAFLVLVATCAALMATVPVIRLAAGVIELSPRQSALALGTVLAAAVLLMREKFAVVLTVFTVSVFAADIALSAMERPTPAMPSEPPPPRSPAHILYIVLDEHIGIGGLPPNYEECECAAKTLRRVLARHRFRHFTHAYSNYPSTVSSLSSLLNRRLLERRREFLDENSSQWRWGTRTLLENRLLSHFQNKGYSLNVVQHRAINHVAPGVRASVHEYWDELGRLERASGPWNYRFRWLVGNYQQSDLVLSQVKAFFPFRFAPHTTGPLSAEDVWPRGVSAAVRAAPRPSFFFVHLMAPHFPYLYRSNGAVRDIGQWIGDRVDQRSEPHQYEDRYRRYCEQLEYVANQLNGLFTGLEQARLFDAATIVLHGDHGSRIRMANSAADPAAHPAGSDPERFDYPSKPPLRDLLDRFSTLLAVKPAGAVAGWEDDTKGSLLHFLYQLLPLDAGPLPQSTDSVFLFDERGRPRAIPILTYWSEKS